MTTNCPNTSHGPLAVCNWVNSVAPPSIAVELLDRVPILHSPGRQYPHTLGSSLRLKSSNIPMCERKGTSYSQFLPYRYSVHTTRRRKSRTQTRRNARPRKSPCSSHAESVKGTVVSMQLRVRAYNSTAASVFRDTLLAPHPAPAADPEDPRLPERRSA